MLMVLQLSLFGCSSKSQKKSDEGGPLGSEFVVDDNDAPLVEDGIVESEGGIYDSVEDDIQESTPLATDSITENIYDDVGKAEQSNQKAGISPIFSGNFENYTVQEGETLMWISYKLYGDYRNWKKLKSWNEDLLNFENKAEPGTNLRYQPLERSFSWETPGSPYLVLRGDTLFKISRKVYDGDGGKWKSIWANNKVQIRDPDLIFAGFTLFIN